MRRLLWKFWIRTHSWPTKILDPIPLTLLVLLNKMMIEYLRTAYSQNWVKVQAVARKASSKSKRNSSRHLLFSKTNLSSPRQLSTSACFTFSSAGEDLIMRSSFPMALRGFSISARPRNYKIVLEAFLLIIKLLAPLILTCGQPLLL